jgi:hypothetical protein
MIRLAALLAVLAAAGDTLAQPAEGNRCFTPQFWCWLPGYAYLGTPCYCATPYGPVNGVVGR